MRRCSNWLPGPERETPERVALNSELRREVQEGITLLPEDLRAAVVLRDIQELSTTEAAEVLGITIASLKARLHRGRVLLRKYLEAYIKTVQDKPLMAGYSPRRDRRSQRSRALYWEV